MNKNVAVLCGSREFESYSYKTVELLREKGYHPVVVYPGGSPISDVAVKDSLKEILEDIDTVSVYASKNASMQLEADIIELKPRRVIFNPGTENDNLRERLELNGIQAIEASTLILLRLGRF